MAWLFRIPKKTENQTGKVKIHVSPEDGSQYILTSDLIKDQTFRNQLEKLTENISDKKLFSDH